MSCVAARLTQKSLDRVAVEFCEGVDAAKTLLEKIARIKKL